MADSSTQLATLLAGGGAGGGAAASSGGGGSAMLSTDAPSIIEHYNASVAFVPADTRWVPGSPMFAAMGGHPRGTGALHLYKLTPEGTKVVAQVRACRAVAVRTRIHTLAHAAPPLPPRRAV